MFADGEKSLQAMLIKKYGVGLPSTPDDAFRTRDDAFRRWESSGEGLDMLIQRIHTTLVSRDEMVDDGGRSCQKHLDTLVTHHTPRLDLSAAAKGGGGGRGVFVSGQLDEIRNKTEGILRRLPPTIPLQALEALAVHSNTSCKRQHVLDVALVHVVLNECRVLNRVLEECSMSMRRIDMALLRTSVLGGDKAHAVACAQCLLAGQVPQEWIKCSYPSTKPLAAWLRDLTDVRVPQVNLLTLSLLLPLFQSLSQPMHQDMRDVRG